MANYEDLKQAISNVIKENGNNEITGSIMQNALLSIISIMGKNSTFAGVANTLTNPSGEDGNVFYIATESGGYVNFGDLSVNVDDGINILNVNANGYSKLVVPVSLKKAVLKEDIKTKPGSLNVFNKNDYLQDRQLNSNGTIITAPNAQTTGKIYWKDGETHITVSGTSGSGLKRLIAYNENDQLVGNIAEFFQSPRTVAKQTGVSYVRVMFHNPNDPGSDVDTLMINWGQTALPYVEPIDVVVKIGDYLVKPDPEFYYDKQGVKDNFVSNDDLEITKRYVNQLFRIDDYLQDAAMAATGVISQGSAYAGGQVTGKIYWKDGETHITISGYTGSSTKYIVSFNDNDERVGVAGSLTEPPYTYPKQTGVSYVRVYFHSRFDPGDDSETVMINWGQTALPHESGIDVVSKIKGYPLDVEASDLDNFVTNDELEENYYNKQQIDNLDFGVPEYVDRRYLDNSPLLIEASEFNRMKDTVLSLRSLKSVDSGVINYTIPGTSQNINEPVTIPVNIHWGNQIGDLKGGEIFMNESCRKDFSDIRFLDSSGNLLDAYKVSHGNYEFVYDQNIKGQILGLPKIILICPII